MERRGLIRRTSVGLGLVCAGVALAAFGGCAGPMPLDVAVRAEDEKAYAKYVDNAGGSSREAFLRWKAAEREIDVAEAEEDDASLDGAKSPFKIDDAQAISYGALIYSKHCMECHGPDADGHGWMTLDDHPAEDFTNPLVRLVLGLNETPSASLFTIVANGEGPTVEYVDGPMQAMPAFRDQLSNEQIWLVLTYLASRR